MKTKNKTILSKLKIEELSTMVDYTLELMELNREKFTGNARKIWKDHFSWSDKEFEFDTGDSGCGDAGVPRHSGDAWYEMSFETQCTRTKGKVERLRLYSVDKWGDSDTELDMTRTDLKQKCLQNELVYFMFYRHAYYQLLKQYRYNLDCIQTGKDPLEWVFPESEEVSCTADVTVLANGNSTATLISGDERALKTAHEAVICKRGDRREFSNLEEILKEYPDGSQGDKDLTWQCTEHKPGESITIRVNRRMRLHSCTATHIREVYSRRIEEEVKSLVAKVEAIVGAEGARP